MVASNPARGPIIGPVDKLTEADSSGVIEAPWASAAVPNLAFPETVGRRPPDLERTLRFRRALNRLATADAAVHQKVLEVQHVMKPRSS